MSVLRKEHRELKKAIEREGFTVTDIKYGKNHPKLFIKEISRPITFSGTTSDRRSIKNIKSNLRKMYKKELSI